MKIIDIIEKAAGAADSLKELLVAAGERAPDLKPELDGWIAKLEAAVDPSNLVALAEALPSEIAALAQGHLDPRKHPSDLI